MYYFPGVCFHELPPRFMRPPLFSGQRWSWRLGPGLEGLAGALLVSKKNKTKQKQKVTTQQLEQDTKGGHLSLSLKLSLIIIIGQ